MHAVHADEPGDPYAVRKNYLALAVQRNPLDVPEQCCGLYLPTFVDKGSARCSSASTPLSFTQTKSNARTAVGSFMAVK
jgi:hypothetical protein